MPLPPSPYNDRIGVDAPLLTPEDVVFIAPKYNTRGRRDATGAFHLGVERFAEFHGLDLGECWYLQFDNKASRLARAHETLNFMEECISGRPFPQVWLFFQHGYIHGIQSGFRGPNHPSLTKQDEINWVRYINFMSYHPAPIIVYFACSTGDDPDDDPNTAPGSGDESFADETRDALCRRGCTFNRVFAHVEAGHAWYQPTAKIMDGNGSPEGGMGGDLIVSGRPALNAFKRLLEDDKGDGCSGLAWRMPFMHLTDIRLEIAAEMSNR